MGDGAHRAHRIFFRKNRLQVALIIRKTELNPLAMLQCALNISKIQIIRGYQPEADTYICWPEDQTHESAS
jgi:hypothetical protein